MAPKMTQVLDPVQAADLELDIVAQKEDALRRELEQMDSRLKTLGDSTFTDNRSPKPKAKGTGKGSPNRKGFDRPSSPKSKPKLKAKPEKGGDDDEGGEDDAADGGKMDRIASLSKPRSIRDTAPPKPAKGSGKGPPKNLKAKIKIDASSAESGSGSERDSDTDSPTSPNGRSKQDRARSGSPTSRPWVHLPGKTMADDKPDNSFRNAEKNLKFWKKICKPGFFEEQKNKKKDGRRGNTDPSRSLLSIGGLANLAKMAESSGALMGRLAADYTLATAVTVSLDPTVPDLLEVEFGRQVNQMHLPLMFASHTDENPAIQEERLKNFKNLAALLAPGLAPPRPPRKKRSQSPAEKAKAMGRSTTAF